MISTALFPYLQFMILSGKTSIYGLVLSAKSLARAALKSRCFVALKHKMPWQHAPRDHYPT